MPPSRDLATYKDVMQFADAALEHGGAKMEAPSQGKAINLRLRFNAMCKLYREENHGVSPWDNLMATQEGRVVFLKERYVGKLSTWDGEPLEAPEERLGPVDQALLDQVLEQSEEKE